MRNRLTFPSGGTEPKYVWDRYALQNNGIYVWDTHNVVNTDIYYWDKYSIKGQDSYTWDKYSLNEAYTYCWNKYGVTETIDYTWTVWKTKFKNYYFTFSSGYELDNTAQYSYNQGYLKFFNMDGTTKVFSVTDMIAENIHLPACLASGYYGYATSSSASRPTHIFSGMYSNIYISGNQVMMKDVRKINSGYLVRFGDTSSGNTSVEYSPFGAYPEYVVDTIISTSTNEYPLNGYDSSYSYYYECQNLTEWANSTTGIIINRDSYETLTSTNENAYSAGLYNNYFIEYVGETVEYSKGDYISTVTSSNGGAYPKDGKQGDYWYVMQLTGTHIWNTYSTAPVQTWDVYSLIKSNKLISATAHRSKVAKDGITFYAIIGAGTDVYPDTHTGSLSYQSGHTIVVDYPFEDYSANRGANVYGGGEFDELPQNSTYPAMIRALASGEIDSFKVRDTSNILLYSVEDKVDYSRYYYIVTNDTEIRYNQTTQKYTITNLVKIIDNIKVNNILDNLWHPTINYNSGSYWEFADGGDGEINDFYIGKQDETPRLVRHTTTHEMGYLYPIYIPMARDIMMPYDEEENPDEDVVINSSLEDYEVLKEAIEICRFNDSSTTPYWTIFYTNNYCYTGLSDMVFETSKGTTITGSVSSTDRYAYPNDGELNGYWYIHSGVIPDATSFIGTVESRDKNTYPLNGELNGIYYVYSHLVDDTIQLGDFIGIVESTNPNAFPQNNVNGDYWYIYKEMKTFYSRGSKTGTIDAETKQAYPADAKLGNVWYVYSHFENNGPYKSRWVDEIETNIRSTYPTNGIQGNYWYVYKKTYTGYKLQINDWQIRGGVDYKHNINPEKDFTIGCVSSAEIAFNYDNTEDDFQKYLDADYCDYWTWQPEDTEWRLLGRFWLTDAEYERKNVKVKAFDAILATDTYVDDFIANTTYPITLTNFFNSLCEFLGVVGVINTKVVNRHIAFPDNFEAINITARQLFQYIAEMGGAFIQANTAGQIYLTTYTATGTTLDNSQYTSYAKQRYNVEPISGLTVKMNTDDLGVSSGDIEANPYIIENNPLFYAESTSEIQAPVDVLYNSIKTKVYRPATINLLQDFNINCGDIITVNGDTFYVMSKELSASGCKLECFGNQYRDKKPQSINSNIVALRGKTNELYRDLEMTQSTLTDTANGLQSQITQTANEINLRVTNEVEGLESEITQTAESINLRVTNEVAGLESKITQTADSITSTVTDEINEAKSEIKQTTDSISLTVQEQGDLVAQLVLDVDGISARGYVTFTDLAGSGTTVINGDNITTGTINADRINMTGAISWGDLSNSCQNTIASFAGSDADVPDYIGPTSISAVDIMSPRIYGGTISAGTTAEGYMKMSSSGMDFKSDTGGNLMGIGFYPGRYNYPYIIFGDGVDSIGTDRGMIKKYAWGIWIGDNDGQLNDEPTGTGIMIDFVNHRVLKYENGTPAEL